MKLLFIGGCALVTYCLAAMVSDRVSMDMTLTHWTDARTYATFVGVILAQWCFGFALVGIKFLRSVAKNRRKMDELRSNVRRHLH